MSQTNSEDNRTLTLNRMFNAPIQLVWDAWTQPGHIAQWWGPKGMETTIVKHDFKVGGEWEYAMMMPNGSAFIGDGVYLDIVELKKIYSSANFKPMTEGVEIRAYFEKQDEQTQFTFKVVHPTEAYCKQQRDMGFESGWESTFDRLETLVNSLNK